MSQSRRAFLGAAVSVAAVSVWGAVPQSTQQQPTEAPRQPTFGGNGPFGSPPDVPGRDPRALLKANQEKIKKNVSRLTQLVGDLQKDLDANDTKDVLPLNMLRKAEEVEKLAREIKSLVRG